MKALIYALLLLTLGCGKNFKDGVHEAEPLFSKTQNKNEFLKEAMEFTVLENLTITDKSQLKSTMIEADNIMNSIPINLYDVKSLYPKEGFVAVCRKSSKSGRREILVDRNFWNSNSSYHTVLILHELGHCRLGREHLAASGGCRHIMESSLISLYNPSDERIKSYFANDLFKPINPCVPLEKYITP